MKLNSKEILSRETVASARTLSIASGSVILVEQYNLKPLNWPIFQEALPVEAYVLTAGTIIAFSTSALVIHWYSDYLSYAKWFKSNSLPKAKFDSQGSVNATEPVLDNLRDRIDLLGDCISRISSVNEQLRKIDEVQVRRRDADIRNDEIYQEMSKDILSATQAVERTNSQLEEIQTILDEIPGNFTKLDLFAKLTLYGWYLAAPIFAALCAFLMLAA
ncbi:hypothetical protein SAMN05421688_0999 [Poseidonocella pacifica]|uniref:Uncharacterized protein n=1 Tax=Poseidonocella pacifica TaxID=871651 RepID=A0A1I0VUE1_9RHOB|nr:hypothetical protein [Poseidonocella pacifica]SFA80039.1 hypothetical protein SAMN05421688_0999 [Poseidonocella pacifica]